MSATSPSAPPSAGFARFLPFLLWWPLLRKPGVLRGDVLAGLTGAIVVLPQAIAFATLAGMPPQYGLYAAMLPCLVAALFGSSRVMMTGPANAIALTTGVLMAPIALAGSDDYIRMVVTLSFLVGVLQIGLGLARAGRLIEKVPHSVIVGFTCGAAVLIVSAQLPVLTGVTLKGPSSVAQQWLGVFGAFARWQALPIAIAFLTIVIVKLWAPLNRRVPAMLVGVVAGTLVAWLAQQAMPGLPALRTVPPLPGALPSLSVPDLSLETLRRLVAPCLVMTMLASIEAVAISRALAVRHGHRLDGNQEFIGQGMANIVAGLSSAIPASGSFNRSAVNSAAGAQTPMSGVVAAFALLGLLVFVGPLASLLPLAVISGLLLLVAYGLVDRPEIARIWRHEPYERATLAVTFFSTVALSLEWAILLGLLTAMVSGRVKAWRGH
ncbi:MAG TPA: SulP family inorganic anion transporter [Burkholderiaceae bacterium]|mgnify:CR=1 FL=1|jgi:SulP family sulfate permease|nr:SulP family inorganic anion transporter [Burkholderiaceae bacterium]